MMRRLITVACAASLLGGCGWAGWSRPEPTIGSLPQTPVAVVPSRPRVADPAEAMRRYQSLLDLKPEARLTTEATRRLADLELERSEARLAQGREEPPSIYAAAIKRYETLLETYPGYKATDKVLYQLARAYEQAGKPEKSMALLERLVQDHPASPYVTEAWFRRGEFLFTRRDYADARHAYQQVLQADRESTFHDRALYKLGWTLFKEQNMKASMDAFMALLDRRLPQGGDPDPATLPKGERTLLEDTLRAVSLGFSSQGGAKAVRRYFAAAPRDYEYLIYRHLGDLYLKQERIQDAASTFLAFVEDDPAHPRSPGLQVRVVEAYAKGGFGGQALAARESFVRRYRVEGEIWQRQDEAAHQRVRPYLKRYLRELSRHYHALAQAELKKKRPDPLSMKKAVEWYQELIASFPNDPATPSSHFLMAELLFDYGRFPAAAEGYEQVAYGYGGHPKAAEAGYAALLAYAAAEKRADAAAKTGWQRREVESALRFADRFPDNTRWALVLTRAAERLFALGDVPRAIEAAKRLTGKRPPVSPELMRTAWTVIAHGLFEQTRYADAEAAYGKVLRRSPPKSKHYSALQERLAASIYRQGEAERKAGRHAEAAGHFLRVGTAVPGAAIRAQADFDAAASFMAAEQWPQAAQRLEQFRKRHPQHGLRVEAERNLAVAYLKAGKGVQAAGVLTAVAAGGGDAPLRRDAGWQAAELYEKAGQVDKAVQAWRHYVKAFPIPVEPAVEARWRLAGLAARQKKTVEQTRWLKEIVQVHGSAGKAGTARTRYLAAKASLALAEREGRAFDAVQLVHPLKANLKRKKERLQAAIDAYGKAAEYAVAEVTTAAAFHIAHIYQRFGQALIESERPRGLSQEEQEQYVLLLEEQAWPFEEKAIELHRANALRAAQGGWDDWVAKSFAALASLQPVRYARRERITEVIHALD